MAKTKSNASKKTDKTTPSQRRQPRLGRGLSALMAQPVQIQPATLPQISSDRPLEKTNMQPGIHPSPADSISVSTANSPNIDPTGLKQISIGTIKTNPHQPRQRFSEAALTRLADSINSDGLMQPIIVRPFHDPSQIDSEGPPSAGRISYELVAGERRLRAAEMAGLDRVPAIVKELNDRQLAEWAIIENLQREDLNPIERAQAFQNLIQTFGLSHDEVAQRVGVERPTVTNLLRLLTLSDYVKELVRDGLLSAGQAKALGGVSDPQQQRALSERAVSQGWSVRQLEQAVRKGTSSDGLPPVNRSRSSASTHLRDLEQQVGLQLQTKVKIRSGRKKGSGTLSIDFYSLDQFDSFLKKLGVRVD